MKVLITGGAGYIGSHVAQTFLRQGLDVVIADNLATGFREAIPANCQFVECDVTDFAQLNSKLAKEPIDAIIHMAAKLIAPESVAEPISYYRNNLNCVLGVLELCRARQIRNIVFSSTAAVYGNPTSPKSVTESDPTEPINPYGASKLMCERILRDAEAAHGIRHVILRYFNAAGAAANGRNGQRLKQGTSLIKVLCEIATKKRDKLTLFGNDYATPDGTCVRDYIHVEDLADLHLSALEHLASQRPSLTVNCGYGSGASVQEVVNCFTQDLGQKIPTELAARRPGDPERVVADVRRLQETLTWRPKYNRLVDICGSALEWEKKL